MATLAGRAAAASLLLLVDTSGSMAEDGKAAALNLAVCELLKSLRHRSGRSSTELRIIVFGDEPEVIALASDGGGEPGWRPLEPQGATALGAALIVTHDLVTRMPESQRLAAVLVSDGCPTDEWRGPMERLSELEQWKHASRAAIAIGADADLVSLATFAGSVEAVRLVEHSGELGRLLSVMLEENVRNAET